MRDGATAAGDRRFVALAIVLLALASVAFFLAFRDVRLDDAYITFRYAENVARGEGYVFNPGERVLGATSPLHALLLALVAPFGDKHLPLASNLLGTAALFVQALVVFALLLRPLGRVALLVALVVVAGISEAAQWLPLETNLSLALVLCTLAALGRGRPVLTGLSLGAAFLCRYDAALLVPLVAAFEWRRCGRPPLKLLAVALAVVAPWLVFAWLYFGSPLPDTLAAKRGLVPFGDYLLHFVLQAAERPWGGLAEPVGRWPAVFVTGLAWAAGARFLVRTLPELGLLVAYGVVLVLAYSAIGPFKNQGWHVNVPLFTANLCFLCGVLSAADGLRRWRASTVLGLALVALWTGEALAFREAFPTSSWWGRKIDRYHLVADWMRANAEPGASLFANEFGALGYLTELRMVDPHGLINATNDFPHTRSDEDWLALVRRFEPDLVLANTDAQVELLRRRADYRVAHEFPWKNWAQTVMVGRPEALLEGSERDDE